MTRFPIESDLRADNIKWLSDSINEVYDDAESGMWKRPGVLGLTKSSARRQLSTSRKTRRTERSSEEPAIQVTVIAKNWVLDSESIA